MLFINDTESDNDVSEISLTAFSDPDRCCIEVIDEEAEFYDMEDEWNRLTDLAGGPVYVTFDWLWCWWKHFGRHPRRIPYILAIRLSGRLIGIVPLYRGVSSIGSLKIQTRLHLMGSGVGENEFLGFTDDYGYSDFLDAIVHPNFEEPVARLLAQYLLDFEDVADCICLQHVSDESFIIRSLLPHLQERFKYLEKVQLDECPYISLPDSMKTYIKNIGSSSRRRRFRKNLKPAGSKYKVLEACTLEEVRSDVERLHELHQERWHTLGFPGAFSNKRYCRFFEEMSERAFRNGWLWLKKAKDEEGCAAIRWTLKYNNRFYDCTSGFDVTSPSAKYSPGLGLLAVLIDDAIRVSASRVELLRGTERYKFDFTRASRYNWRIRLPLYRKKSAYYALLNTGLCGCGRLYASLRKEIKLLKTHRHREGWMKALWSYGSFRLQRLKSKLKNKNIIKKIG